MNDEAARYGRSDNHVYRSVQRNRAEGRRRAEDAGHRSDDPPRRLSPGRA